MSVQAHCQREVQTVSAAASIRATAQQMESNRLGCLIVVDAHERPVGVITDRDVVLRGLQQGNDPEQMRAGDIMSKVAAKARGAMPINTAILRMGTDGVRRMPVIDPHGRLAGVFTYDDAMQQVAKNLGLAADAIRSQSAAPTPTSSDEGSWEAPTARRYRQTPITLAPDASVRDAIDEMAESGTGSIVVVDDTGSPTGIVTDRDIMCRVAAIGSDPQNVKLSDIMSKDVAFADQGASLQHILEYAKERGVRRIPLVDSSKRLVAIVTLDDVIAELASELSHLANAAQVEMRSSHWPSLERR
jgi:CBS domain-containing protein